MELALWHQKLGYYMTRDGLGAAGDFITAPEISQMFGELLGVWAAEVWAAWGPLAAAARRARSRPRHVDGRCAAGGEGIAALFLPLSTFHLVEASPVLKERQIADAGRGWHQSHLARTAGRRAAWSGNRLRQ